MVTGNRLETTMSLLELVEEDGISSEGLMVCRERRWRSKDAELASCLEC